MLSDTYFCNFSIFQSMPDSWAIKQLFPIMPIHRLTEAADAPGGARRHHLRLGRQDRPVHRPARRAQHARTAPVRRREPYYLGAFLLGAYQEILGDLHNLFGDTNAVHVSMEEDGTPNIDTVIKGDTVTEVLNYVQYSAEKLTDRMRKDVEKAVRQRPHHRGRRASSS